MIVIGSKAMLYQIGQTNRDRYLKSDYDVLMTLEEFNEWCKKYSDNIVSLYPTNTNKFKAIVINYMHESQRKQYEIEVGFEGTSTEFLLDNHEHTTKGFVKGHLGERFEALTLEYLALTKRSHLIYPVHFEKNMEDYHNIRKLTGDFFLDDLMQEYYILRSQEAKERYKQRTPKLNVTTEDFFSSKLNVPTYFIHDHIHEVMKHHEAPIYTKIQKDKTKAWCEKDMFFNLPFAYRVQCVQEEAYVIALERYILPQYGDDWQDYFGAYKKAVKRICTTLTSGWFRDFAIENYDKVIDCYNPLFVEKFALAVKNGDIKVREGRVWDKVLPELNQGALVQS